MTRSDNRQTLADRAARTAERIESWEPSDETRSFVEDFAATDFGAEINGDGIVRDAWIVLQPGSPRVEFSPHLGPSDAWGTVTVYDDGEKHTTHVNPCEGMEWAAEEVRSQFRHTGEVDL